MTALATIPALLDRLVALLKEHEAAPETDTILNTREMAKLLRIGPSELSALVKRGTVPAWYVGNGWRYSRQQVLAAFRAEAQRAADAAREGDHD